MRGRPRVLVLSRTFPNAALPTLGLWVRRLVDVSTSVADPLVVAPVPWLPPLVPLPQGYARFRQVPDQTNADAGYSILHPRVPLPPGSRLQAIESRLFLAFLRGMVLRLHENHPFDLLHAHFIYPDGVVAAELGARMGVPVVTTEHAHWIPWMKERPATWRQVRSALDRIHTITTVSEAVRQGVEELSGGQVHTRVLPNVVDEDVFRPDPSVRRVPNRVLFVGAIRHVKGFDVLIRALALLMVRRPDLHVRVVGDPYYAAYRRDVADDRRLAEQLGVIGRLEFTGRATPVEVAAAMRKASVVVVPSRRESFSAVTVEALACGTPVVATRCGGPEEIMRPGMGELVEAEDPEALAAALDRVLAMAPDLDGEAMRASVVERFGHAAVATRIQALYRDVLQG